MKINYTESFPNEYDYVTKKINNIIEDAIIIGRMLKNDTFHYENVNIEYTHNRYFDHYDPEWIISFSMRGSEKEVANLRELSSTSKDLFALVDQLEGYYQRLAILCKCVDIQRAIAGFTLDFSYDLRNVYVFDGRKEFCMLQSDNFELLLENTFKMLKSYNEQKEID